MLSDPTGYAHAGGLVRAAFDALLPAEAISVAAHAEAHRWIRRPGNNALAKFTHDDVPYLRAPMEALSDPDVRTVALVGPGQSAKTVAAECWLLQSVDAEPGDMLWYMQTDPGVVAFVRNRIGDLIEAHDQLKDALGHRAADDALHHKRFSTMGVEFLSATHSNLISKSAAKIVADEVDAYDPSLGDVKALLDIRRQAAGDASKLLMSSHPDLARGLDPAKDWDRGIMAVYADSTRAAWYWPCPRCGARSSPHPLAPRVMRLDYPADAPLDEVEAAAHLRCPACDGRIADHERRGMLLEGRWIRVGETMDADGRVAGRALPNPTAGFWWQGVMSPFLLSGIGGLARTYEKARREAAMSGEEDTLRGVVVKQLGIPFTPARRVGQIEAAVLQQRGDPALGVGLIPDEARFLTVAADVQLNRFEIIWRAWGIESESWLVDLRTIPAETTTDDRAWDALLALMLMPVPLASDPARALAPRCALVDGGGVAGVTEKAYGAWRRARAKGVARNLGQVAGRDAWNLAIYKGDGGPNGARLALTYPDSNRRDRRAGGRGDVPQLLVSTNAAKDDLAGHLARAEPGPGYLHLPAELLRTHPGFADQATAEARSPRGVWAKRSPGSRNEALDLLVMSHAAARLHGLRRIRWDRPPPWAAPLEANSGVVTLAVPRDAGAPSGPAHAAAAWGRRHPPRPRGPIRSSIME